MEINDNPYLLWLVVGGMLVVGWVVVPLASFYRYVEAQHCLQTFGRRPETALVMIETLEKTEQFRGSNWYQIVLKEPDGLFRFDYEGDDRLRNESNYNIFALHKLLEPYYEAGELVEIRWVRNRFWAGDEGLMTHIAGEQVPATCTWGWIPVYVVGFVFFAVVTVMVISVTSIAQQMVEQKGAGVSQEKILTTAVDRWVEWLEDKFGGGRW